MRNRGVVVGNIYEDEVEQLRRRRVQFQKRARAAAATAAADVWDSSTGNIVDDQTGLTVHHEVDPELKQQITNFTAAAKSRGIWVAAGFGLLLGLLLAGLTWWFANQAQQSRALLPAPKAKRRKKAKSR